MSRVPNEQRWPVWRDRIWATPRILSLLSMLEFDKISTLLGVYRTLGSLEQSIVRIKRMPAEEAAPLREKHLKLIVGGVDWMAQAGAGLEIPWLEGRCSRLLNRFRKGDIGEDVVIYESEEIAESLRQELDAKKFFVLEGRDGEYYADSMLGAEAASRFPLANEELNEAGKCFSLGRYTASVFHSMRALEPALSALRINVRVPKAERATWGPIIDQIEAKIRAAQTGGSPVSAARKSFLSEAAAEFRHFKDAWRNHAMHSHQRYDREVAQRVLNHVKAFVEHLSTRIRER